MINFAHRGASSDYPENTILALKEGIKCGAKGLEIDVHKSKDNKLVVIHDEDIERTFLGKGLVKDFTLEELKSFKNRKKLFRDNDECHIPTLEEVLDLIKDIDILLNIELKTDVIYYSGIEEDVINLIKSYGIEDKIIISSFNHESIKKVKDISFDVSVGDIIAIVGPSGSGKSTLLRCLNMIEVPSSGKIIFEGTNLVDKNTNLPLTREKIGMVFQQFNLFNHLSVLDNLMLAPVKLKVMGEGSAKRKAMNLLEKIGLKNKALSYPSSLSGGQKQRVAIVRTLMMEPDIILFDEPTSALDPEMVGEVLDLIKMVAEENKTMIIVSHEMNFVKSIATRILFLDNGKILFDGSNKEFFNNKNERIKMFLQKVEK